MVEGSRWSLHGCRSAWSTDWCATSCLDARLRRRQSCCACFKACGRFHDKRHFFASIHNHEHTCYMLQQAFLSRPNSLVFSWMVQIAQVLPTVTDTDFEYPSKRCACPRTHFMARGSLISTPCNPLQFCACFEEHRPRRIYVMSSILRVGSLPLSLQTVLPCKCLPATWFSWIRRCRSAVVSPVPCMG